jgi:nitrogen fixation NifU-like protein
MSELRELYQELILEHSKAPRNFRQPAGANQSAEGYNPLCGDHFTVYLEMDGDSIRDIGFQGSGCAVSKASASMMTQMVKGKSKPEAERIFRQFRDMVAGHPSANAEGDLGKLTVFAGVAKFPARVKCATLAWHALQAAIERKQEAVTTE